jgi:predicted phage tail component-like protein
MIDWTFDSVSAEDMGFITKDVFIPPMPEIEAGFISIPALQGLKSASKKFLTKPIRVLGFLEGTSFDDMTAKTDAFNEFLYHDTEKELIFDHLDDRFFLAQYLKPKEPKSAVTYSNYELEFTCSNPFAYAIEEDDIDQNGIITNPFTWNVNNGGYYFVWPIVTITFHQIQTHIYISNTSIANCRFDITKDFQNDSVLVIDFFTMLVKLNDVYSMSGVADGGAYKAERLIMKKGNNILQVGSDDATLSVDVNIRFRKTYY